MKLLFALSAALVAGPAFAETGKELRSAEPFSLRIYIAPPRKVSPQDIQTELNGIQFPSCSVQVQQGNDGSLQLTAKETNPERNRRFSGEATVGLTDDADWQHGGLTGFTVTYSAYAATSNGTIRQDIEIHGNDKGNYSEIFSLIIREHQFVSKPNPSSDRTVTEWMETNHVSCHTR